MSEIMKIIDVRERQKKTKIKTERSKGLVEAIMKVWELNDLVARLS